MLWFRCRQWNDSDYRVAGRLGLDLINSLQAIADQDADLASVVTTIRSEDFPERFGYVNMK